MKNKSDSRYRILCTASNLFKIQGYHATGLNQIIKESGAPKGSIYYYFLNGKEELAIEAIKLISESIEKDIRNKLLKLPDPVEAILSFIKKIANEFNEDKIDNGVSISLLALETALVSEPLRNACKPASEAWENIFAEKLILGGFDREKAAQLGITIHIMIEGAITLCLTKKDKMLFYTIIEQIAILLKQK